MTKQRLASSSPEDDLKQRVSRLGFHGVIAHWDAYAGEPWLPLLVEREEEERKRRSLERRIRNGKIGQFKPIADFDWSWPRKIDRELVEELFTLDFLVEAANVILLGPNGVGKTTIAQNLAYQTVLRGYTVRFTTASEMLGDLASQESPAALSRRLSQYCKPSLLVCDEIGYLSYSSRHADLLFEVISRRNKQRSTVITTNRVFSAWNEVFPNATCVVALVDRLIHKAEIVQIDADSYRVKEAKEREARMARARAAKKKGKPSGPSR